MTVPYINISSKAFISPDARVHPSIRGSKLVIRDYTQIYDFVLILRQLRQEAWSILEFPRTQFGAEFPRSK